MPIQTVQYKGERYEVITANKSHEPAYRKQLCKLILDKYGPVVTRNNMLNALNDVFDFYATEIHSEITKVRDIGFFIFVYFLHEESTKISYLTQKGYDFPVEHNYFVVYRRVLKMVLQESCNINLKATRIDRDGKWMAQYVPILEKIIYLGHFLFDTVQSIAEEKITNGSIDIRIKDDLITFANTKEWDRFIYSICGHFNEDVRESIIDVNLHDDFNKRIKSELGIDLNDVEELLAGLNNLLQNRNPPELCPLSQFIELLKERSNSTFIDSFINGLILNTDNVTNIKAGVLSPYTPKRVIHKPILTLNFDDTPCILVEQFSFAEAMNTFFQNGITLGKIPEEWADIPFIKTIRNDYLAHHKNILENPVEESLKNHNIPYQRNVKALRSTDGKHLSINKTPGEIDFIFLLNTKIYIADCKNLTKRYEMRGYYQDIAKFEDEYNPKMKEKLKFLAHNRQRLEDNLRIELKNPGLDISSYQIEGVFIINTPTLYALNGEFKTYTFHRFNQLLEGNDFFDSYIEWPEGIGTYKIQWPFIHNLQKAISNTL